MNRITLAVVVVFITTFAAPAFAGDCISIKDKQYCEIQPAASVAPVVVQQPQLPCLPPSGWVRLANGNLYCQPPIQYVPAQSANSGMTILEGAALLGAGALFVRAISPRGHDVYYVDHHGGGRRWGH